ncbi:Aste57867_11701 [Aphanomyces stellatus]|uniref:Aste57867_11701 protein n=1 Tax=Aphanomyces stellatus TaxID=120398 RepID=A0A485KU29_9STRA|nr:hypothetical protein As57867_011658 [Aphanomyces stellatus]VFT88558.1 Aste57867_11701 [Aphanomyces stellatus]
MKHFPCSVESKTFVAAKEFTFTACDLTDALLAVPQLDHPRAARHEDFLSEILSLDTSGLVTAVAARDQASKSVTITIPRSCAADHKREAIKQLDANDRAERARVQAQLRIDDFLFTHKDCYLGHSNQEMNTRRLLDSVLGWLDANDEAFIGQYETRLNKLKTKLEK